MLKLIVTLSEDFDQETQEFLTKDIVLELEHSLVAISKWESIFKKPFISEEPKTTLETIAYIKAMTLTTDLPEGVFSKLEAHHFEAIAEYMDDPMTATWFSENPLEPKSKAAVTSELVYYWMTQVPMDFYPAETWHFNRLTTLLRIANTKNSQARSQGKAPRQADADMLRRRAELNRQRRAEYGSNG